MKQLCTSITTVLLALLAAFTQDTATALPDLALQPAQVITEPGPNHVKSSSGAQGVSAIERAAGGRLWAAWYADKGTRGVESLSSYVMPQSANVLDFTYTKNKSATDVTYTVEWSDDLATWDTAGITQTLVPGSDNGTTQQIKATVPAGGAKRFVRLKVTRP